VHYIRFYVNRQEFYAAAEQKGFDFASNAGTAAPEKFAPLQKTPAEGIILPVIAFCAKSSWFLKRCPS